MSRVTISSTRLMGTPKWFFRWIQPRQPLVPKILALLLAGVFFLILITSVRIRVVPPEKSTPRRASVIYLNDDSNGTNLSINAREGGPFPSRFELSQWVGINKLEDASMASAKFQPPHYQPKVDSIPLENEMKPEDLAARGERFFPIYRQSPSHAPELVPQQLAPVLSAFSEASKEAFPEYFPTFEGQVDETMAAVTWRFLLRINPAGTVVEAVSIEKGGEAGALALEKWLRQISFKPETGKSFRWISVGIGFINQAIHGTDPR